MTLPGKVKKVLASVMFVAGYILSPLSWWNDAIINLPIAYLIGKLLGIIHPALFPPGMIVTYWLTNILGLALMHQATRQLLPAKFLARLPGKGNFLPTRPRRQIIKNIIVTGIYTIIISLLIWRKFI